MFRTQSTRRTRRSAAAALIALLASVAAASICCAADDDSLEWHRISAADVGGKGWTETEQPFDRLPAREVNCSPCGLGSGTTFGRPLYRFRNQRPCDFGTMDRDLRRFAMPHMPASGVSGVDLYLHREGRWHFLGNGRPKESQTSVAQLAVDLQPIEAEFRIYLPLYNGVSSLEIGISKGAAFRIIKNNDANSGAVVIYGTSITQGGCASRPGMSYPAILGRNLNVPVVNLGFSGNGKSEPEVAQLLSELNASAFVIDPLANLFAVEVAERLPKFLEIIRSRHPNTPILLMETPLFPDVPFSSTRAHRVGDSNDHLRVIHKARVAAGDQHIWLVPACDFTANGGEATVDGVHPTDVGFLELANAVESPLRAALEAKTN